MFKTLTAFLFVAFVGFENAYGLINLNRNCPSGTTASFGGDKCWMLVSIPMNFIEAAQYCQSYSGNLTSIHDAFDNILLADRAQILFSQADLYYIGGSNLQDRKTWLWMDGSAMDYNDWANYEPIDATLNNCLVVGVGHGMWHSHDCTIRSPFVCEVPEGQYTTTTAPFFTTSTTAMIYNLTTTTTAAAPFTKTTTRGPMTFQTMNGNDSTTTTAPASGNFTTTTIMGPSNVTFTTTTPPPMNFNGTTPGNPIIVDDPITSKRILRHSSTPNNNNNNNDVASGANANSNPLFKSLITSLAVGKAAELFPKMVQRRSPNNSRFKSFRNH